MQKTRRTISGRITEAWEQALRRIAARLCPELYEHKGPVVLADAETVESMRSTKQRGCFRGVQMHAQQCSAEGLQVVFVSPMVSLASVAAVFVGGAGRGETAVRVFERLFAAYDLRIGVNDANRCAYRDDVRQIEIDEIAPEHPCDVIYCDGVYFVQLIEKGAWPAPR